MNEEQLNKELDKTKGKLFFQKNAAFLGSILCNTEIRWSKEISTAATDGVIILWNPDWYTSLPQDTRVTVLAHELWHIAFQHPVLGKGLEADVWNEACDHVINNMLNEQNYSFDGTSKIMDKRYAHYGSMELYDILLQNRPNGSSGQLLDNCEGNGGLGRDVHPAGSLSTEEDSNGQEKQMSQATAENKIMQKVTQAATTAKLTNKAGDIPGEVQQTIDEFLEPRLDWRTLLYKFFNEMTEVDYSYRRPNRRYEDPILPSLVGVTGLDHLMYFLDVSGSVTDKQAQIFNSEVKFIKEEFNPRKLTLILFDTVLQAEYVFEMEDEFESIKIVGRGGTSLNPVIDRIEKDKPNAAIIFSDMWVSIPQKDPKVPIIWVCVDNKQASVPYGQLIHISEDDY